MGIKQYTIRDAGDIHRKSDQWGLHPTHHNIGELKKLLVDEINRLNNMISFIHTFTHKLNVTDSHFIRPFLDLAVEHMKKEELGDAKDDDLNGCE